MRKLFLVRGACIPRSLITDNSTNRDHLFWMLGSTFSPLTINICRPTIIIIIIATLFITYNYAHTHIYTLHAPIIIYYVLLDIAVIVIFYYNTTIHAS